MAALILAAGAKGKRFGSPHQGKPVTIVFAALDAFGAELLATSVAFAERSQAR